jgi:thiosulfate dehydrogenase [quinone] large subunit
MEQSYVPAFMKILVVRHCDDSMQTITIGKTQAGPSVFSASLLWPLRIFMGATFLYAGLQHLTDPAYFDPSKPGYIGNLVSQYAVGSPIHNFLLGLVVPNAVSFGYAVGIGESLIGIATLLGLFYRLASFAGLLLNLTFFLSATWNAFPFYFGSDIVFVMCWLTLLIVGPQPKQSVDGVLANHYHALRWLVARSYNSFPTISARTNVAITAAQPVVQIATPQGARFYPGQIQEVNRAFDRIKQQFVMHRETQTILEFVRALVISLGVDRNDTPKILSGLQNIINRRPTAGAHTNEEVVT